MSERSQVIDDVTMQIGLLMETAQADQRLAETSLEKLRAITQDLDRVVRDEIRRTLVEEVRALTAEFDRVARELRDLQHRAGMRVFLWTIGVVAACTLIPSAIAHFTLPSAAEISALRSQRDALGQSVARLERQGGKADWRSCGDAARLCVRVDRKAPVFGEKADYYIVRGY